MNDLYKKYFQKSHTFLYPILRFHKTKHPRPKQTYTIWKNVYTDSDKKLICVYIIENSESWKHFELNNLMTHSMLETSIKISATEIAYVFDFSIPTILEDFDMFIAGKYSKFSNSTKKLITAYYGIHTAEWVYIESYIHPKKYFKLYADLLGTEVEILEETGELCEKPNFEKETYLEVPEFINL
jgi:hypothetical protein